MHLLICIVLSSVLRVIPDSLGTLGRCSLYHLLQNVLSVSTERIPLIIITRKNASHIKVLSSDPLCNLFSQK